jgi:hypothetical protein
MVPFVDVLRGVRATAGLFRAQANAIAPITVTAETVNAFEGQPLALGRL